MLNKINKIKNKNVQMAIIKLLKLFKKLIANKFNLPQPVVIDYIQYFNLYIIFSIISLNFTLILGIYLIYLMFKK